MGVADRLPIREPCTFNGSPVGPNYGMPGLLKKEPFKKYKSQDAPKGAPHDLG